VGISRAPAAQVAQRGQDEAGQYHHQGAQAQHDRVFVRMQTLLARQRAEQAEAVAATVDDRR
jgi:hypothetical protein